MMLYVHCQRYYTYMVIYTYEEILYEVDLLMMHINFCQQIGHSPAEMHGQEMLLCQVQIKPKGKYDSQK